MAVTAIDESDFARDQSNSDILNGLRQDIADLRACFGGKVLHARLVADVASIAAGAEDTQDVTVTGAAIGDFVDVSIIDATPTSGSLADASIQGYVSATNTVTVVLSNLHASTALDLSAAAEFVVLVRGAPATNKLVQLPAARVTES